MKKVLLMLVVFLALVFPLACNDLNNAPSGPLNTSGTATPTPSSVAGAIFLYNYGTSSAPNGLCYNASTQTLFVACGETGVSYKEVYDVYPDGSLSVPGGRCGLVTVGCPTPSVTPSWEGTAKGITYPQRYIQTNTTTLVLDSPPSGSAVLYQENRFFPGIMSFWTSAYGSIPFVTPKGLAVDSTGTTIYVADTGNGYVEVFEARVGCKPKNEDGHIFEIHRWNGSGPDFLFKQPRAIACDSSNNVIIGDAGYSPSIIQTYSSGGTTIINHFQTIPNCVVYDLAVDSSGNIFVADMGNNLIEVYDSSGNLLRMWGDPHSPHEFMPFRPACLAIVGDPVQYVIVGDAGNDLLQVFQY